MPVAIGLQSAVHCLMGVEQDSSILSCSLSNRKGNKKGSLSCYFHRLARRPLQVNVKIAFFFSYIYKKKIQPLQRVPIPSNSWTLSQFCNMNSSGPWSVCAFHTALGTCAKRFLSNFPICNSKSKIYMRCVT